MNVSEEYPSLFHYTTLAGLEGILSSQALWATHYRYLNDAQEVTHAKIILKELLRPKIEEMVRIGQRRDPSLREITQYEGGEEQVAAKETEKFIEIMYNALFKEQRNGPYILSFCGASTNDFVRINGLLSQWRGYGSGGGYAIEFDTKEFESFFKREISLYYYSISLFLDVGYGVDRFHLPIDFQEDLRGLEISLNDYFNDAMSNSEKLDESFKPFVHSIFRNKHQGFSEENEVRAVLYLGTEELRKQHTEENWQSRRIKPVGYRQKEGTLIPYVSLSVEKGKQLPIKRIIVGPHKEKEARTEALKMRVKDLGIEVACSEIPFLG